MNQPAAGAEHEAGIHVDVLIIGAGVSGIGAAWRLQQRCPRLSYAILEARDDLGGTWDLFRYPGIRSDSDMHTFGYPFRPWLGEQSLADGGLIKEYVADTAREAGIDGHIRFGHRVVSASWSSDEARWTVQVQVGTGPTAQPWTARFLWLCSGYYDYEHPHRPAFFGEETFGGRIIHAQQWPEGLDWDGQRVVVVGSGATAVTLVPALADGRAASVTMLQRSPTYLTALPAADPIADALRRRLPPRLAHQLVRARNVTLNEAFYQLCRHRPEVAKRLLRRGLEAYLPDPAVLDEHFTPSYEPWDQRLCVVPDGDLLRAIASGAAEVVTDRIERFVPSGIELASGRVLPADLVVLATGLTVLPLGGLPLEVDGQPVDVPTRYAYRGLMLSGVPNLAFTVGYTNASWTLRADLVARYVTRLLRSMARDGVASVAPRTPTGLDERPLMDLQSGYLRRAEHLFPRVGRRRPWAVGQDYLVDRWLLPRADVTEAMDMVTWAQVGRARVERAGTPAGRAGPQQDDGRTTPSEAALRDVTSDQPHDRAHGVA